MYGYGYRYNSGLVLGSGGGGGGFTNTYSTEYDGVDDKVEIGTQSLGITGAISVSAWVKIPTTNTGGASPFIQVIFGEETRYNPNRNWALFWRGGTNLNGFSAFIYDSSGVYTPVNSATPTPNDNQWHHLMFTYTGDTTTNGLKLFVDGVQIAQATSANGGLRASSTVIPTIGGVSNSTQRMFEGSIDEASIFDSAISIGDVWDGSGEPTDLSLLSTPPVAWYRMGDNGAYKSPQWLIPNNENKDKVSNYSFEFDGVDTSIQITPLDIDTTSDLTLSCWVKSNGFTTWDYLVTNGSTGGTNSLLNLRFSGGGALFSLRFGSSVYTGLNGFADGNWHHIAMTINYTNGDVKFYKDGVVSSTVLTWGSVGTTARIASIGAINSSGSGSMSGSVDEFAVFQGLQSITDLYNGGEPTTISGAVAHYKMGEEATFSTNWTVPDQVGSNDGVSANMTIEDRVGEAPNSTSNSVSYNMDEVDRVEDTP